MNTSYLRRRETEGSSGDRVRRLSDKEWRERKTKGLCYRCDEKWSVNHKCSKKEHSVLITYDEEDDEEEANRMEDEPKDVEEREPMISVNSVVGITNPK